MEQAEGRLWPMEVVCGCSRSALQLRNFLSNNISRLTRRGTATVVIECGMERSKIQVCGGWLTDAMDGFFIQ